MAELKKLLSALIKGNGSFEQVNAAVQQYVAQSPQHAPLVAKLLKAARDAGLPHPMYVSLSGGVTARIAANRAPDPGAQALEGEGEDPERTLHPSSAGVSTGDTGETRLVARSDGVNRPPAGPDDDRTVAVPFAISEEKTRLPSPESGFSAEDTEEDTEMEAGLDDDQTALNPGARGNPENGAALTDFIGDNSSINPTRSDDADGTLAIGQEVDFDVFAGDALASGDETAEPDTGASWPTILEEQRPGISRAFREGDLLRGRFELVSKLGEGGMGTVWKGKDLLKEEARDRNPFVAIKLLQRDFKEHPEAFIALQRETAKQQRLAHPNVATVYDFDRDDASNTVFMTMEVLEGQPLDAFIRKLPRGGLPVDEAMPLIEQLCNGLGYAHSHGLVHADLKPGNCFFTKDGTIKLLDFGIARASKTKADAEGETTVFDPGELGALTPAYATVEMFEGIDPDPRDDIYALAIMTYQLLTGKHPYGKKRATQARQLGLKPKPVPKLNKRQNKALMRGLAFERDDRIPTVEAFFESIRPRKSRVPLYVAAGLAAVLIVGLGVYGPDFELIDKDRRERVDSTFEQRVARIDALKNDFTAATRRDDVQDADAKLAAIRAEGVSADDPFLATEAPLELANAYLRLAQERIEDEQPDFEQALALARKGLEHAPGLEALSDAVADYEVEVEKQLETALRDLFGGSDEIDVAAARTSLDKLEVGFPDRYPDLRREFAETRANHIRQLVSSNDSRISSLGRRLEEYKALFPEEAPQLNRSVADLVEKQIRAARISSARDLEALSAPLAEFRTLSPEAYASLSNDISSQLVNRIRSLEKTDRLSAANLLQASIGQFGEAPFRGISIEIPR